MGGRLHSWTRSTIRWKASARPVQSSSVGTQSCCQLLTLRSMRSLGCMMVCPSARMTSAGCGCGRRDRCK
eukprot:2484995-Pyramimonas_sp.AAC.1